MCRGSTSPTAASASMGVKRRKLSSGDDCHRGLRTKVAGHGRSGESPTDDHDPGKFRHDDLKLRRSVNRSQSARVDGLSDQGCSRRLGEFDRSSKSRLNHQHAAATKGEPVGDPLCVGLVLTGGPHVIGGGERGEKHAL